MQFDGKNVEVIVQAGGRGSRLRHFTWNKPKCLVSYNGKPVIYYLFDYLSKANFHIIADYQINKIKKYFIISPPKINYKIYNTNGSGTCSGIQALEYLKQNSGLTKDKIVETVLKNLL